jgi:hypothetical protein
VDGGAGEHFRLWLRAGMTGCEFAKLLAGKAGRIAIELHVDSELPRTDWLDNTFIEHAKAERVVIAVFPSIATELALVEFLNVLSASSRWKVRRRSKTSPAGNVLVGLEWNTPSDDVSETMGFAPFGSMPVPRRAPYVAIATWPGSRSNPFRGSGPTPPASGRIVSFLDVKHGYERDEYETMWTETTQSVASLMIAPPDDAKLYRRAAFVISPAHAAKLSLSE